MSFDNQNKDDGSSSSIDSSTDAELSRSSEVDCSAASRENSVAGDTHSLSANSFDDIDVFDFAIIGAGVVGTAIAREITKYTSSVILIDVLDDVGAGTSKANTAILHTGFDMKPGTLESKLVSRGYKLLLDYSRENGICIEELGAILVAWNETELNELQNIKSSASKNGYHQTKLLSAAQVYELEENLAAGALGGLLIPDEFIIDPWSVSVAFATQAVNAGAKLQLNAKVEKIKSSGDSNIN